MNEKQILEKLKQILSVSKSVNLERIRRALGLDQDTFDRKIFSWAAQFGFEIDREYINISGGEIDNFIEHLEKEFTSWQIHEKEGFGKVSSPLNSTVQSQAPINTEFSNEMKQEKDTLQDTKSKMEQRCAHYLKLGDHALNSKNPDDAIISYQRAKEICDEELFDQELSMKIKMLLEEAKELKKKEEIIFFRGAYISQNEANTLANVENITNIQFSHIPNIKYFHGVKVVGFSTEYNRVIAIRINGFNLKFIPESIRDFKSLQYLDLSSNEISDFLECIIAFKSLKELILGNNNLEKIPEKIGTLLSLEHLSLYRNDIETLPEAIGNLTSLKTLHLGWNHIKRLPSSIGRLTSLETLFLGYNNLETLPDSIGKLISLRKINLYNNKITNMPKSIANLPLLENLNLTDNPLTKEIKNFLKENLKKIPLIREYESKKR